MFREIEHVFYIMISSALFLVKTNIPPLFFLHPQISSGRFIPCQRKTGMVMPPDRIIFAASLLYFLCSRD